MYKERDVESLWEKYSNLLGKLKDENVDKLVDSFGQRILTGSYSQREKEPFCGIGGLVEYSLGLAKTASNMNNILEYDLNKASIIKCSLLCILGKVGTLEEDRFSETTSEWHKEKLGQYYDWNESCPKYQTEDMSLFILQNFGIHVSWSEWQAIKLLEKSTSEENKFYGYFKERLSIVMQMSHDIVMKNEKDKIDGLYTKPF
jgi:hypothetical protein